MLHSCGVKIIRDKNDNLYIGEDDYIQENMWWKEAEEFRKKQNKKGKCKFYNRKPNQVLENEKKYRNSLFGWFVYLGDKHTFTNKEIKKLKSQVNAKCSNCIHLNQYGSGINY